MCEEGKVFLSEVCGKRVFSERGVRWRQVFVGYECMGDKCLVGDECIGGKCFVSDECMGDKCLVGEECARRRLRGGGECFVGEE